MFDGVDGVLSSGGAAVTAVAGAALAIGAVILLFKTARRIF
jgi:hypothetical protein